MRPQGRSHALSLERCEPGQTQNVIEVYRCTCVEIIRFCGIIDWECVKADALDGRARQAAT